MQLGDIHTAPFDRVYETVTQDILVFAHRELKDEEREWLLRLVDAFWEQRQLWNERPELEAYRMEWNRFQSRLMRLVAGAYLHIGYDLPRAMADEWPGSGRWWPRPEYGRAYRIYLYLKPIFPRNFARWAGRIETFGKLAPLAGEASFAAIHQAGIWVENLRRGAWEHALLLATEPHRELREEAMAKAMVAALEDVTSWRPLTVLDLRPPDDAFLGVTLVSAVAFQTSTPASPLAVLDGLMASPYVLLAANILSGVFTALLAVTWLEFRRRRRERSRTQILFINAWGRLLSEYLAAAMKNPEGFDTYRHERRVRMGLEPPVASRD